MEPVTLTSERLVLHPLRAEDIPAVHRACQDPEIARWTAVPSPYEWEDAKSFVTEFSPDGWRNETMFNFGAYLRGTGELVSSIGLARPANPAWERIAEIGYWTAREHRRRGYTAEGVTAVARWAFTALGVQRLEWLAEVGNTGSRAVAEKAGFTIEGTLRSRIVHRGTRRDAWIGSLLPSDLGLPEKPPALPYLPYRGGAAADGAPAADGRR